MELDLSWCKFNVNMVQPLELAPLILSQLNVYGRCNTTLGAK